MMNIEDYIKKNQSEINYRKADKDAIWEGIQQIQSRKKTRRIRLMQISAAAAVLIMVAGMFIRHEMVMQQHIDSLSQINSALANKEATYKQEIQVKWQEFQSIQAGASPIESMLIDELKVLDTIYQQGLNDLKTNSTNDRAVIILLETYEKRLRIIEKLIYERHKQLKYEKRNQAIKL